MKTLSQNVSSLTVLMKMHGHTETSHEEDKQETPRVTIADASGDPSSLKEALASSNSIKLINAMEKEIESSHANDVWDLVELPKDRRTA